MVRDTVEVVYGDTGKSFIPSLNSLAALLTGYKYEIISEEELLRVSDPAEVMKIYCSEIMYRAHWAAATSILRTHRWTHGVLLTASAGNYLSFAASFRGLLESAGDIAEALTHVPLTLAEHYTAIRGVIESSIKVTLDLGQLEEKLIHFTHARKIKGPHTFPKYHKAETNTYYIEQLQRVGETLMIDCYSELCQLAHPAAPSVLCFVTHDGENTTTLNNKLDYHLIEDFCQRHRGVVDRIFPLSMTPAVCIMKILNRLPLLEINTPEVEDISLENVPLWNKIEKMLPTSS